MSPYIIANWKMNNNASDCIPYAHALEDYLTHHSDIAKVVICPPTVLLPILYNTMPRTFSLGVQNFYPADCGSYTGEESLTMFDSFGASYALIGHSERRQLFGEDGEMISKKLAYAAEKGYTSILCIGESAQEKQDGQTEQSLKKQLGSLTVLQNSITTLCIAYEPLWAIGTGIVPTMEDIALCAYTIQKYIQESLDCPIENVYTLYGGSVNQYNVASILAVEGIHGVLIGNASLNVDSFVNILQQVH